MKNEENTNVIESSLHFEPSVEIDRICSFIRGEVKRRGVRGVVIGLSGGLDSTTCAYLCQRCLPARQIHLVSLPDRDSSATIHDHAHLVARALDLPLEENNQAELFEKLNLYEFVPGKLAANRQGLEKWIRVLGKLSGAPALYPWAHEFAFGQRRGVLAWVLRHWLWKYAGKTEVFIFGKVRARMMVLSQRAMQMDCLLVCTTDRSEYSVGFYDPHGDGVGDVAPLVHLYKTQIRKLARALGVPEVILQQPSSGDLAAGLPNETVIGMKYEQLDRVLEGFALGMTDKEIAEGVGEKTSLVKWLRSTCRLADERRGWPARIEERE